MKRRVYARIEGSPELLGSIPLSLQGEIRQRRRVGEGIPPPAYWKSSEFQPSEAELDKVVLDVAEGLLRFLPQSHSFRQSVEITLVIVLEYCADDHPGGLFLGRDALRSVASLGASIDVDAVRK